jgi:hypothetical protein
MHFNAFELDLQAESSMLNARFLEEFAETKPADYRKAA